MIKYIYIMILLGILTAQEKPNILLIMADDVGFSDIGSYGSEIQTPTIDSLATHGLRFKQFYNMAKCDPTRSTMITGLYNGNGVNAADIKCLGKTMSDAGYSTILSGKEHFNGWVPDRCFAKDDFDYDFTFWATTEYFIPPSGQFSRPFKINGVDLDVSEINYTGKFYKTDVITDYAIRYLDSTAATNKPFFLYLPYHVGHYPLQAHPEDIAKYRGKYMKGWDVIRQERYQRVVQLGLIEDTIPLSPPEDNINQFRGPFEGDIYEYHPWDSYTLAQQDEFDLEMSVFAAMMDRMDQNIARVLNKIEIMGKGDNTLIMFLVDNGACPYNSNKIPGIPPGDSTSYRSLRATWANMGNTPYRYYKQFGHEGGSHTPFIVNWPGKVQPGTLTDQVGHVVDMMPTLMNVAEVPYYQNYLHGQSLLPIFVGGQRQEPDLFISGYTGFRMYREGPWKIVQTNRADNWELYNIREDKTELNNLAASNPTLLTQLVDKYNAYWSNPVPPVQPTEINQSVEAEPITLKQFQGKYVIQGDLSKYYEARIYNIYGELIYTQPIRSNQLIIKSESRYSKNSRSVHGIKLIRLMGKEKMKQFKVFI